MTLVFRGGGGALTVAREGKGKKRQRRRHRPPPPPLPLSPPLSSSPHLTPPPPSLASLPGYWYNGRYVIYIGDGSPSGAGAQTYFTGGCFGCGRHCVDTWSGTPLCCPACNVLYHGGGQSGNYGCRPLSEYEWFYRGGGRCVQDAQCEACQYWDPSYSACIIAPVCDAPSQNGGGGNGGYGSGGYGK